MVFSREKGDQSHWILCDDYRVNRSQIWVLETALKRRLVQIIQVHGTIVTAGSEHAHGLAYENRGDLSLMVT